MILFWAFSTKQLILFLYFIRSNYLFRFCTELIWFTTTYGFITQISFSFWPFWSEQLRFFFYFLRSNYFLKRTFCYMSNMVHCDRFNIRFIKKNYLTIFGVYVLWSNCFLYFSSVYRLQIKISNWFKSLFRCTT